MISEAFPQVLTDLLHMEHAPRALNAGEEAGQP
jgi:hypothetical protein